MSTFPRNPKQTAQRRLFLETLEERRVMATLPGAELVKSTTNSNLEQTTPHYVSLEINGTLYLTRNDDGAGIELWKTDGTTANTKLVKDIRPGGGGSYPFYLTNVNGTLFFVASDGTHGTELWKSDGTAAGTVMVKDIQDGVFSSGPHKLSNVNGVLYFSANDFSSILPTTGAVGEELWKSDGTAAGTVLIKDINTHVSKESYGCRYCGGPDGSSPSSVIYYNGAGYFTAMDDTQQRALWRTDGTADGTDKIIDTQLGYSSDTGDRLFVLNDELVFTTGSLADAQVWHSDGTADGTEVLREKVYSKTRSLDSYFVEVNGTLFFTNGPQRQLLKTDGTSAGTKVVKQLMDPLDDTYNFSANNFTNVNGTLYFATYSTKNGGESTIWKSDGSANGTVKVVDSTNLPRFTFDRLTNAGGQLYFVATSTQSATDQQLYKSNGTLAGTQKVFVYPSGTTQYLGPLSALDDSLYFEAKNTVGGRGFWKTNDSIVVVPTTTVTKDAAGNILITDTTQLDSHLRVSEAGGMITIQDVSGDEGARIVIKGTINGVTQAGVNAVKISRKTLTDTNAKIAINTLAGNDQVDIDTSGFNGFPIPVKGLSVNLGDGEDTLAMVNNSTNNNWNISQSSATQVTVGVKGTINVTGIERAVGGFGTDTFRITNTGANLFTNLDGGGGVNEIIVNRDMNATLTDITLNVQPLNATQPIQTFNLQHVTRGTLVGGPGNNFFDANTFTGNVVLRGGDGNDILWAGKGNDTVDGGNGNDFLGGGPGEDILLGQMGHDILIGGAGADKLNTISTSTGQDLLIGGRTTYGFQKAFVDAILGAWTGPESYTDRVTKLSVTGVGNNKQFKLSNTTVLDDAAIDNLVGGYSSDWFFAFTTGISKDTHDAAGSEQVVVLS